MSAPNEWPSLELDPVRRLRVLAAGLPHVAIAERVIDAPFDTVWGFIGDLALSTPQIELGIRSVEIVQREGERLALVTRSALGFTSRFEVVLRPGWCLMHNRQADVGMAAVPEGDGTTRYAHYEGVRLLGRLGRPLFARKIEGDLDRVERLVMGL